MSTIIGKKKVEEGLLPIWNFEEVQAAIDRAFAYWSGVVGARQPKKKGLTKLQKQERAAYLSSLTEIIEKKRSPTVTVTDLGILRNWQSDPDLAELIEDALDQSPGYYNIMRLVAVATPDEIEYWQRWYFRAHKDIAKLSHRHKVPMAVATAVVAVLSPGNSWPANMSAADYIMTHRVGAGSGAYGANAEKALFMLDTWSVDQVSGPKVTAFYESLRRPYREQKTVVLDGHMINIWRGNRVSIKNIRQPSKNERAWMLSDYETAAHDCGLSPQALQALTWYIWRFSTDNPKPPEKEILAVQSGLKAELRNLLKKKESQYRRAHQYMEQGEEFWGRNKIKGKDKGARRVPQFDAPLKESSLGGIQLWEAGGRVLVPFIGERQQAEPASVMQSTFADDLRTATDNSGELSAASPSKRQQMLHAIFRRWFYTANSSRGLSRAQKKNLSVALLCWQGRGISDAQARNLHKFS